MKLETHCLKRFCFRNKKDLISSRPLIKARLSQDRLCILFDKKKLSKGLKYQSQFKAFVKLFSGTKSPEKIPVYMWHLVEVYRKTRQV